MRDVDYPVALQQLYDRINYERSSHTPYTAQNYRLDRMRVLLQALGNPQDAYDIIHIAGTKGKGTTAHLIYEGLRANGIRTGLYTSPHLLKVEERFQFDGRICTEPQFVSLVDRVLTAAERIDSVVDGRSTFFEITTAMGMLFFAECGADAVVLEVGLGGRLDSTNVCQPILSIITSISLDHQAQLGSTISQIAGEKAGIIKSGVPVISTARHADARAVIRSRAAAEECQLWQLGIDFDVSWQSSGPIDFPSSSPTTASVDYHWLNPNLATSFDQARWPIQLLGRHQADNVAAAITAFQCLTVSQQWKFDAERTRAAVMRTTIPGRLQILGHAPVQIVDTAHNPASVQAGIDAVAQHFSARPRIIVFASSRDKDYRTMLSQLIPNCEQLICTAYLNNPRAVPADELLQTAIAISAEIAANAADPQCLNSKLSVAHTPAEAWNSAMIRCPRDGIVLAIGSFFLAAELFVLPQLRDQINSSAAG